MGTFVLAILILCFSERFSDNEWHPPPQEPAATDPPR